MKNRAFTLIELLVVVLIIGILSAIALPQYQKAVEKARLATMLPLLRSVAEAQYVYKLANGQLADKFDELDITLPGNPSIVDDNYYRQTATLDDFRIGLASTSTDRSMGRMTLSDDSVIQIYLKGTSLRGGTCEASRANSRADALCKTIGTYSFGSGNNVIYYDLKF